MWKSRLYSNVPCVLCKYFWKVCLDSMSWPHIPACESVVGTSSSKIIFLKIYIDTAGHLIIETLPVHSVHSTFFYTLPLVDIAKSALRSSRSVSSNPTNQSCTSPGDWGWDRVRDGNTVERTVGLPVDQQVFTFPRLLPCITYLLFQ